MSLGLSALNARRRSHDKEERQAATAQNANAATTIARSTSYDATVQTSNRAKPFLIQVFHVSRTYPHREDVLGAGCPICRANKEDGNSSPLAVYWEDVERERDMVAKTYLEEKVRTDAQYIALQKRAEAAENKLQSKEYLLAAAEKKLAEQQNRLQNDDRCANCGEMIRRDGENWKHTDWNEDGGFLITDAEAGCVAEPYEEKIKKSVLLRKTNGEKS